MTEDRSQPVVRFVLNGQQHELTRERVTARLAGVTPDEIRQHAVLIGGTWFPVKQAFEVALGVSRTEFISHTARRHLAALGFELAGGIEPRAQVPRPQPAAGPSPRPPQPSTKPTPQAGEWHTEANVQARVVAALVGDEWQIVSVANTATKEHGIDVVATRDSRTVGVEVKGFPSRGYADPRRSGEVKRTSPSTQSGHWYSQAVLAAMRLRSKHPGWLSVIALPDFPRYRDLHAETVGSLSAAQIEVWWVPQTGEMQCP